MPLYVKKLFAQDPHFSESKIVVSAYSNEFSGVFSKDVHKKVAFDGFESEDIALLKKANHLNMMKNALQFADGLILGDDQVPAELKQFAEGLELPILHQYQESDYLAATDEFFDHVLAAKPELA
jgi:starch synthase